MTPITRRFSLIILTLLIVTACGLSIEVLLSLLTGWPFGHTQSGHLAGWLGLGVLLTAFVYSIKKRQPPKRGWPAGWFVAHQVAGALSPFIILVHSGPHFHALVPLLAFITMVIAATSGMIGLLVHRKAIRQLNDTRKTLVSQGLSKDEIEDRLFELASEAEMFRFWQTIHVPMAFIFMFLLLVHIGGALFFGGW